MTMWILILFVPVLVAILLGANLLLAAHRPDYEKVSVYECGMPALATQTRHPFSISYYLVAVLFLIFDLEIALIFPVAISLKAISSYGFWIAMAFLSLLTVGFVFEWSKGAIRWSDHRSAIVIQKD